MTTHADLANAIRFLSMDAVERAKSGHPGMPMGMADVGVVLFQEFLKACPKNPTWPNRDRFVLSAGHGSMFLYAINYLLGYEKITLEDLKNFRQLGSKTHGHPEYAPEYGIETTTGPLGQGLANAVGIAVAEEHLRARFGADLVDHYTYVVAGDGCLMEGVALEAASFAGHQQLGRLIVLFDDNHICIDGDTSLSVSENTLLKFEAMGWHTLAIDGHDPHAIRQALTQAQNTPRPSLIACRTTIGYGAPTKAGTESTHGSPLGATEIEGTRKNLNWPHQPFVIPDNILKVWREAGARHQADQSKWQETIHHHPRHTEFLECVSGKLSPEQVDKPLLSYIHSLTPNTKIATRKASQQVLEQIGAHISGLVGGSADLTGSNLTKTKQMQAFSPENRKGNYIHYGVREHAMAAIMNGLALYGLIPYGGTFLVFADYMRGAMRLSALMEQRVIYVLTHDSIGLGEDGPTHQPIEHLSSLSAMPNMLVFRPADAMETAVCWGQALHQSNRPSVLALSRQELPIITTHDTALVHRGAYLLETTPQEQVRLFASGSEVQLALDTAKWLAAQGIAASVVSVPCMELFFEQPIDYQHKIIGQTPSVAIEAASHMRWYRMVGRDGLVCGMDTYGASAPAPELFAHFGFTPEKIGSKVLSYVKGEK
jgi:transketolase